jgi:hypothetical protein
MDFGMALTILGAAALARGIMRVIVMLDEPEGRRRG